ncbi:putative LysR-family transcriptional regulator [Candidatus Phaeomarinobacter ectocarpi]|uniref:Putative LysR-family transcriptional regulator n=1 Tax=Candidatus Phaeomarinibacter ectocarpi TaxID=1458461 RepID=X5MD43_9HYPH|nr:LysR family transcriptional regulator [Candidatus Phaeomarinobacter ectocarpi]CDO59852.1 putative LysR-family transcriptional regulator [Candidatus Phaeomarinobacter ectocarpi]
MIRLDRKHLALVCAIAREGTMTAAANALAVSQPALSKQLTQLEEMLGTPLFERTGKSTSTGQTTMRLTRPGRAFEQRARSLLEEFQAFETTLNTRVGGASGRLRIATDVIHNDAALARAMRAFTSDHPGIELDAGPEIAPLDALTAEKVDLAIVGEAPTMSGVAYTQLEPDELVAVMRADHGLAAKAHVTPDDLEGQEIIYHLELERSILHRRHLKPAGIRIAGFHRIESPAGILAAVADSDAVSVLPRRVAESSPQAAFLALRPIGEDGYWFHWHAARRRTDSRAEVAGLIARLAASGAVS